MAYSIFADYTKRFAHTVIDETFPRTDTIALISAGVGWYTYRFGMTWIPGKVANTYVYGISGLSVCTYFPEWFCKGFGVVTAPLFAPEINQKASHWFSIGASCATSLALNLIAKHIFKIKPTKIEEKRAAPVQHPQRDHLILKTKEIIPDAAKKNAKVALPEKGKKHPSLTNPIDDDIEFNEDKDDLDEEVEEIDEFSDEKILPSKYEDYLTDDEPDDEPDNRLLSLECLSNLCN